MKQKQATSASSRWLFLLAGNTGLARCRSSHRTTGTAGTTGAGRLKSLGRIFVGVFASPAIANGSAGIEKYHNQKNDDSPNDHRRIYFLLQSFTPFTALNCIHSCCYGRTHHHRDARLCVYHSTPQHTFQHCIRMFLHVVHKEQTFSLKMPDYKVPDGEDCAYYRVHKNSGGLSFITAQMLSRAAPPPAG